MIVTIILAFAIFGSSYGYEGLALGGLGASNNIELVTKDKICAAAKVIPAIPSYTPAANPTWVAEYVDETIYLCGGQVINR